MKFDSAQDKDKNDSLKDLITYFAQTVAHLQEVKLNKLIYIAQLYHYSNCGELLTGTRFFSLGYGPHAPLTRSTLKTQLENRSLYLTECRTSPDPVYSNPCLIIKASDQNQKDLPRPYLNTLKEVAEDWGDKSYEHILDYTTRTIPYLSTCYREPIEWTLIRPWPDLKCVLSLPKRVQIHKFVEEPQKAMYPHNTLIERSPVTVHEVAEIYLALRGELADEIPSQACLGFNLQTVCYAFDKLRENNVSGPEKYRADIDKAAQLTHSLLNSMSFTSYSSRVALKTGILYLIKLGYYFDGDVLEDNWPDENSPEALTEWFSGVSRKLDSSEKRR